MPKTCHNCGEEWVPRRAPGYHEECAKCSEPLYCCANCKFYDSLASQWCREPQARDMRPRDHTTANTCDWFMFGDDRADNSGREAKAKRDLAGLFGETADEEPTEKADWMKTEKKRDSGDIFKS